MVVTANYKLTFDIVRRDLKGEDLWLLVIDTRGINVWCAAGKGTFSTEEVTYQVKRAGLEKIVSHRTLILPQLSATGVDCLQLKKLCGFRGILGPVRISDLPSFIKNDMNAEESMRSVTFNARERAELIPVELYLCVKPLLLMLLVLLPLSGLGPGFFSMDRALSRTALFFVASVTGLLSGAVLTPLLLAILPFRQFWLKGVVTSLTCTLLFWLWAEPIAGTPTVLALALWIIASGSFLAMNFTGSTPYTSLSGVEFEMRRGLPVQIGLTIMAVIIWFISPFI